VGSLTFDKQPRGGIVFDFATSSELSRVFGSKEGGLRVSTNGTVWDATHSHQFTRAEIVALRDALNVVLKESK
jgi:hypothetical protein